MDVMTLEGELKNSTRILQMRNKFKVIQKRETVTLMNQGTNFEKFTCVVICDKAAEETPDRKGGYTTLIFIPLINQII